MGIKVFLSGGMNQSNWQKSLMESLGDKKYTFFNPREHNLNESDQYTFWDLFYIDKCDILFAYMQEDNPSGYGLTLEVGYAKALNKPIILIDERSAIDEQFAKFFRITRESSTIIFEDIDKGTQFLKKMKNGVISL